VADEERPARVTSTSGAVGTQGSRRDILVVLRRPNWIAAPSARAGASTSVVRSIGALGERSAPVLFTPATGKCSAAVLHLTSTSARRSFHRIVFSRSRIRSTSTTECCAAGVFLRWSAGGNSQRTTAAAAASVAATAAAAAAVGTGRHYSPRHRRPSEPITCILHSLRIHTPPTVRA
jgi:hypothetical protein